MLSAHSHMQHAKPMSLSDYHPHQYLLGSPLICLYVKDKFHSLPTVSTFLGASPNKEKDHLGAQQLLATKNTWCEELDTLTSIAMHQPHLAYLAFVHGLHCRWTIIAHSVTSIGSILKNHHWRTCYMYQVNSYFKSRAPTSGLERGLAAC